MVNFEVNRDTLPMKSHYFFFNAGTAPLVPYLPTYAKQLGFSSYMVGILYTFLPILGLIAKPLFGAIGDRYERHKTVFVVFQILTVVAFSGLYFIPESQPLHSVDLSCGDGETFFSTCFKNESTIDECTASHVMRENSTAKCEMSCSMNTPLMWQMVCEHWNVPQYCYNKTPQVNFDAKLHKQEITVSNDCVYFKINTIIMPPDLEYKPHCSAGKIQNLDTTCELYCLDKRINTLMSPDSGKKTFAHLLCENNNTFFKTCSHSSKELQIFINKFGNETDDTDCRAICKMENPINWMEMCVGWGADESLSCRPEGVKLPDRLNFTGIVPLDKTLQEGQCIYMKLHQAIMSDGSTHYPYCPFGPAYKNNHFQSKCDIHCDNFKVNELLSSTMTTEKDKENTNFDFLWLFCVLMALNWIGMAVVVSIADAICFQILGANASDYGLQRLWGSVGWGIFSLLTGFLIDTFSHSEEKKDYTVAFILMLLFLTTNIVITSWKLKYKQNNISIDIVRNIGMLFSSLQTIHFFVWIVLVGMCTGLLWQFLFWYLEDLAKVYGCDQAGWIKTLQGLVNGIQCFCGEIPFFFFSGTLLKKLGHWNSMSLVLFGFGVRFMLYSVLTNPWWVLPIEFFQGLTFGMLYATMASYASSIAPKGAEATMQGLVGAVFEGVGTSLGSFIGGALYARLGGVLTFRIFGCAAITACLLNTLLQFTFCRKSQINRNEENSSIIHYAAPNDAIDLMNDHYETTTQK